MLTRWSWPFFAVQWARMLDWARREEKRKKRREDRQRHEGRLRQTEAALAQRRGVGGDD